jgi:hypothetical protein
VTLGELALTGRPREPRSTVIASPETSMSPFRASPRSAAFTIGTLLVLGAGSLGVAFRNSFASDHQDTPEVELHPRLDINDVYAFPGSNPNRIALVLTTSSPLTPAASVGAAFDPDILYQIKIDNTGDSVEDVVLQFTFDGEGVAQRVTLRGPVAPQGVGRLNTVISSGPSVSGPINSVLGPADGVRLFAGLRDDPFYIDLEQFFKIIPDRAPVQGPLSKIGPKPEASAFRNPGVDFLRGINALGIVVELPESMILSPNTGSDPKLGIWATTSR